MDGMETADQSINHLYLFLETKNLDYDGLLELFPQNYHEPYYVSYTNEDFSALATGCGLTHIRDVKAFVSKVMVFDKPAVT
jgi:hypothetical protein